jgi:hypothetical protein
MPVLRFDGADDSLLFTTRLTAIRTVFWVVRRDSTPTGYRFLLGDYNNYDFHSESATKLWDPGSSSLSIRNGETRVNGALVNGTTTDRPTDLAVVSLLTTGPVAADAFSRDRTFGRSWLGDLAELVIYDRALSAAEVRSIEEYLAGRYGLSLAP